MVRYPMTKEGENFLREELKNLKSVERNKIIKAITEARKHGDLKENAEYHAAKESQGFIESRIREIERKLSDAQSAADKLAQINLKILKLINYVKDKDREGVGRLIERYNPDKLSETGINARYTSYSVNKGEKISICIRNKEDNQFIDDNIIMFVVIHELSHIMTIQVGHPIEFWDNMKYLLEQAREINLYNPIDYQESPQKYCGMMINSTPYKF